MVDQELRRKVAALEQQVKALSRLSVSPPLSLTRLAGNTTISLLNQDDGYGDGYGYDGWVVTNACLSLVAPGSVPEPGEEAPDGYDWYCLDTTGGAAGGSASYACGAVPAGTAPPASAVGGPYPTAGACEAGCGDGYGSGSGGMSTVTGGGGGTAGTGGSSAGGGAGTAAAAAYALTVEYTNLATGEVKCVVNPLGCCEPPVTGACGGAAWSVPRRLSLAWQWATAPDGTYLPAGATVLGSTTGGGGGTLTLIYDANTHIWNEFGAFQVDNGTDENWNLRPCLGALGRWSFDPAFRGGVAVAAGGPGGLPAGYSGIPGPSFDPFLWAGTTENPGADFAGPPGAAYGPSRPFIRFAITEV